MFRVFGLLFAVAVTVFLPACATDEPDDPNRVSTIPWNRPEKWEGQGPLGGMGTQ